MDVSASRRKPSSGLTSGASRQYVGETGRPWKQEQKNIVKEWIVSQESSLEQKRPGQPVSATNLQSQTMFAMRIM